jgi:hypothetical protein
MGWLDPNTWKQPAALLEDWRSLLVGGLAIITVLATIFRQIILKPFRWIRSRLISRRMLFVQNEKMSFWGRNERRTQVTGLWHVTNSSDRDVFVLRARLEGFQADVNNVVTTEGSGGLYSPLHPVPAHQMAKVMANLFPPITARQEPFAVDVIFTDNFGNEHRVPSRFQPVAPPPPVVTKSRSTRR